MTEQTRWRLDRSVSLGLLLALVLETAGALLWAGRASARIDEVEGRVAASATVGERLARLEAMATVQGTQLGRVEAKLDRLER
jgi:hypothetical protein